MTASLLEYVAVSGVIGRTEAEVQDFVRSNHLPVDTFESLISEKHVCKHEGVFVATEEFQDIYLLENRVIDLTPMARRALSCIAASGTAGILQTDLAKALGVDNKTLFHHMKPLVKYDLITRHPVASKKAFTYLCTLSKFFIEDTSDVSVEGIGKSTKISSVVFKESVLKILSNSKGKTFSTKQLYEQCCPEGTDAKDFRRCLLALEHDGHIEILSTRELGGTARLVRMNNKSGEAMNEDEEVEQEDDTIHHFSAPLLVDFVPVEKQIRDYILDCGVKGATMNDIVKNFGLRKKFAFRLMERLVDKKCVVNTDVTRQAEFVGRERRYKFTIIATNVQSGAAKQATEMNRDSINRVRRQEEILKLLHEKKIVEIGRGMADLIAKQLGESTHVVDVKTLKRTVNLMKANEQLEVHTVGTISYGDRLTTRMVITLPNVKADTPEFKQLLESLDQKSGETIGAKEEVEFVDVNKYDFNFIFGVMERLRQCHLYLANRRFAEKRPIFNTASAFFKDMSLQLFHKLIGCNVKMSKDYHAISLHQSACAIKDLPTAVHRQVNMRLKEHKKIIHTLINIMLDLRLIKEHQELGIVESTRVPFVIDFCDTVTLTDPFEHSDKEYTFTSVNDVERFWSDFCAMARVPEELDIEKPEKWDIRNWSNRPINTAMCRLIEREAERIADTCEDNQIFTEAASRLAKKLLLEERVVSCYLEYYVSLCQPEEPSEDIDEQSPEDGMGEARKRRRRRQDGFTADESLQLKLVMAVVEVERIAFTDTPMWSTVQSLLFQNRSADDLRRKYGNILKSISEIAVFDAVKCNVMRIKQLHEMALIEGKPASGALSELYKWYHEVFKRLDDIEREIVSRQPKSLLEAEMYRWVELAVDVKGGKLYLSDQQELEEDINCVRKALLYTTTPVVAADQNIMLCKTGFAVMSNEVLKVSSKTREWLQTDLSSVPQVMQNGQPLTPTITLNADIYAIYRLYGRGSLTLTPNGEESVNYAVTVDKPSSEEARDGDQKFLWFTVDGLFDDLIFYKSLHHVLDQIGASPGVKPAVIRSAVLTGGEIQYLCDYLLSHDYIRACDDCLLPVL